ncbi:cytochrome C oxidase subunit II [Methyloceanibacter stevinii]|uniref:Cytochrome c oxidase subunit 2 n=1 Tax=Methyloceanibacter stevinii TaxID=1774970 RepID=A0A1E3VMY5_9HYPH|nr:cytochrome c oxidase subunit II [Methyloceanibacter stevinii]ODR94895.1 cytochrome C oxidase subunit II [Methyloceanibacter stevinii]
MGMLHRALMVLAALAGLGASGSALAEELPPGRAHPWQLGFQEAMTPIMAQITDFHTYVTAIIIAITLFVLALMVIVMIRFNEKSNPEPSRTSHNTLLEVAWTVIPIFILVAIAIPSFRLLFAQYDFPKADVSITATGAQWYWIYEYPDENISFNSIMVPDAQLKEGQPRLLTVDNEVVVPVGANVVVSLKSNDVIHDWAVPSFGVKLDAVPGRLQQTWFRAEKEGWFYGQCSELCGRNHAFMPIAVRVVSKDEYDAWVAGKKSASIDTKGKLASARD